MVWTGRAEGARAVSAAMPLVRRAKKVVLCRVGDADRDGVIAWLGEHGITVECVGELDPDHGILDARTGQASLDMADKVGVNGIIMGAYVHSRLRQLIVGGATRTVLKQTTRPVLLAH